MSITKFLFNMIDYLGCIPQNTYHNKNAVLLLKDQNYCNNNQKFCTLDLYCDKNCIDKKQALIVNLHGGGFIAGDKKYRKSFSEFCLNCDVKVININYGLAPTNNLVKILHDLTLLFDWIKANSEKYHFDMSKIILCGDSAGAYLAACLAAISTNAEYAKALNLTKIDTKIAGVAFFSGIFFPCDALNKHMIFNINYTLWEYLCGDKFVDIDTCKAHNLYNYINVGDFITKDFPPVFVSYTSADIFCQGNGEKLVEKLKELDIPYREVHSKKQIHDWQVVMFTKSAKHTLKHFTTYLADILSNEQIKSDTLKIK